jgi:hypothetical protein
MRFRAGDRDFDVDSFLDSRCSGRWMFFTAVGRGSGIPELKSSPE